MFCDLTSCLSSCHGFLFLLVFFSFFFFPISATSEIASPLDSTASLTHTTPPLHAIKLPPLYDCIFLIWYLNLFYPYFFILAIFQRYIHDPCSLFWCYNNLVINLKSSKVLLCIFFKKHNLALSQSSKDQIR